MQCTDSFALLISIVRYQVKDKFVLLSIFQERNVPLIVIEYESDEVVRRPELCGDCLSSSARTV
jgi:hypothetical protein